MITRRSRPTFLLTGKVTLTVQRYATYLDKGRPKTELMGTFQIEGNVQPMKFQEILQMPEADRTKEWIKVFTSYYGNDVEMPRTLEEPLELEDSADYIEWQGHKYKVMKHKRYEMGVLDHDVVYCAREPLSALD